MLYKNISNSSTTCPICSIKKGVKEVYVQHVNPRPYIQLAIIKHVCHVESDKEKWRE